jgi:glycosyltransferase involved in cell wall biosynthesis
MKLLKFLLYKLLDIMKRVALIINFLNPNEKYLLKCLNSILRQSYKKFSIFFIDNNSEEIYQKKILFFLKKKKFKNFYYHNFSKTLTLPSARNFAVNLVLSQKIKFDYIGFCDSDDWWNKDWLNYLIKNSKNYDLLFSDGFVHKKTGKKEAICSYEKIELIKGCSVYLQSMLLSTEFVKKILKKDKKIFNEKFDISYDYDFLIRNKKQIKYFHVKKKLFNYNKLLNSMSSKNLLKIIFQWEAIRKSNNINNFILFHKKSLARLIQFFIP